MNRAQHQMMQIVQKIPVFDGLTLEQAQQMIQISRFKKYEAGDTIYGIGEASDEMLILIKGKLSVLSATGQPLGEVLPGASTGEMGVFTGHGRSASIVAMEECAGLSLTRAALQGLMNNDRDMKSIILENVVTELAERIAEANTRLDVLSRSQQEPAPPPVEEAAEDDLVDEEAEEPDTAAEESSDDESAADDEMPEAEDIA